MRRETVQPAWEGLDSGTPLNVTREPTSGPLSLLVARPTNTDFDSATAHEKATQLDTNYSSMMREQGTLLVDARFTMGEASGSSFVERRYTSTWTLTLARADGQGYSVSIAKTRHVPLLEPEYTTYETRDGGHVGWTDPPPAKALNGTSGTFVYDLGRAIVGADPFSAMHRTTSRPALFSSERVTLDDRFVVSVFYEPNDDTSSAGGLLLMAPFILAGDSKDGWLTYARLAPELRPMI